MHPALSVIFFTVVSGTGYGLLFLLGVLLTVEPGLVSRQDTIIGIALGATLAAAGLLSSTLHLGQPQRAWRALSQWRSSWLSREGASAMLSFVPMLMLAWLEWRSAEAMLLRAWGVLLATSAALTVVCTAKIYTTLKTVRAWHNAYVLPVYLWFALLGGAAAFAALQALNAAQVSAGLSYLPLAVAWLGVIAAMLKRGYWRFIVTATLPATPESATGLGRFGAVRSVEAPHTEENYLTREMGFVLARKHAAHLRVISLVLLATVPVVCAAFALAMQSLALDRFLALVCACSILGGMFIERWLFFAEAKHVVTLYYGAAVARQA